VSVAEVVVDASLALKWVVEEPYSTEARRLLEDWGNHRRKLLAPALFLYEVANALAKRMQRRQFTLEQAKERLSFFLESGPLLRQIGAVHPRALELMERFGLPTAYDVHYLALAESQRCECWTADERLWNTVKKELAWVRWIGERAAMAKA
jgi:predicted nucleic acid-binding protein